MNEQPPTHPGSEASPVTSVPVADPLSAIRGGLVVSCQAPEGDALRRPEIMSAVAASVATAGAVGIRANGLSHVEAIRARLSLPLIGLWKHGLAGVYITPTMEHAIALAKAGADIVAVDGTLRPRPDGRTLAESVRAVHSEGCLLMADVSTVDEGLAAQDAGADVVSTTLSGYTPESPSSDQPDFGLIAALAGRLRIPVVAEGRIRTPGQANQAIQLGAWAVVVGTAITAPAWIAEQFVRELPPVKASREEVNDTATRQ